MPLERTTVARGVAVGRVLYGLAMILAPVKMLTLQTGEPPSGPFIWLARIFGIRDVVLGAGVLVVPVGAEQRRWVAAGAIADGCDLVATVTGVRHLGGRSAVLAIGVAGSAAAAGAWSLTDPG